MGTVTVDVARSEDVAVAVPGANGTASNACRDGVGTLTAPQRHVGRLRDTMGAPEAIAARAASFAEASSHQREYDYRSWIGTTLMWRDRAPANWLWPWALCVAVTAGWVALTRDFEHLTHERYDLSEFERVYGLIFAALGFLLVFRLNRAAVRYWDCRSAWGTMIVSGRAMVDHALVYLAPVAPREAEELAKWFAVFSVAVKSHLRRVPVPPEQLAGVVTREEVAEMEAKAANRPLYVSRKMRAAVARGLLRFEDENEGLGKWWKRPGERKTRKGAAKGGGIVGDDGPEEDATVRCGRLTLHPQHSSAVMAKLLEHVDELATLCGTMERIRATRLPIVYVSHLRTFLVLYIISMPFVYVSSWGWGTIPAVAGVAFALLGVEGAATECENPFEPTRRITSLHMERFCEQQQADVIQLLRWWKESEEEEAGDGEEAEAKSGFQ